jgi:hypothetical protein
MPEISRFFGIVISMFFDDHNPPHFHARYGEERVATDVRTLQVVDGALSPRALGLVVEWAALHQEELLEAWELAHSGKPPKKISPLV